MSKTRFPSVENVVRECSRHKSIKIDGKHITAIDGSEGNVVGLNYQARLDFLSQNGYIINRVSNFN